MKTALTAAAIVTLILALGTSLGGLGQGLVSHVLSLLIGGV